MTHAWALESAKTLWRATANPKPQTSLLTDDLAADVAVIGGGFTGLTAALHLARRGATVALFESDSIGAGASGVNAGFVVPNFAKADPPAVIGRLGEERGRRLLDWVGRGGDRLFETARDFAGTCDAEQTGWLQPAHSAGMAQILRARADAWRSLGRPVEFLSAADTQALTSIAGYHGALIDRSGGAVHPLNYVYGLAGAAMAAGAAIHENAAVDEVVRDGARWSLRVGGRRVAADRVLLCTNATGLGPGRRMAATTVPLRVYQIATEPLDPATVARIAPHRQPVSDTRGNIFTYRLDRDDRLISGGMAIVPIAAHQRMAAAIAQRLAAELKLAQVPKVDFVWKGVAAMTPDFLPHLYEFGPGFIGGVGCNGRGVALTAMLGETLADAASGTKLDDLPIPTASVAGLPFHFFAGAAPSVALLHARWQDWRAGA
jgi:glycine/D-amino acid oxidase-like deaminating enzyme